MNFGERLRTVLEERNISQKAFSEKINIAPTTLNGYVNEKREPSLSLLCTISNVLGVSTDYLIGNDNPTMALSCTEMILLDNFREMSEDRRKLFLELSNKLSDKK